MNRLGLEGALTAGLTHQNERRGTLSPKTITESELADDPIIQMLTQAPANNTPIGGLKVVTRNGRFAARPSGSDAVYKIYAKASRTRVISSSW